MALKPYKLAIHLGVNFFFVKGKEPAKICFHGVHVYAGQEGLFFQLVI